MTIDRRVRFTEDFFDRLELLLPEERGADGSPSVADFIAFEIPPIRDRLARDPFGSTLSTALPDVRACIGTGILVPAFVAMCGSTIRRWKRSGSPSTPTLDA